MAMAALPAIAMAAGTAGSAGIGAWQQSKNRQAYQDAATHASELSPYEQGLSEKGAGQAGQLGSMGSQLYSQSMPYLQQAGGYYQKLLGDRATMRTAVAPAAEEIADVYGGASRGLEAGHVRGGVRDLGQAELAREKAGSIAGLYRGMQPLAASALAGLGKYGVSQGTQATGASGGLYADLLGKSRVDRGLQYDAQVRSGQEATSMGQDLGSMIFSLITAGGGKGGPKGSGAGANIPMTTNPPQGYTAPPAPPLVMPT